MVLWKDDVHKNDNHRFVKIANHPIQLDFFFRKFVALKYISTWKTEAFTSNMLSTTACVAKVQLTIALHCDKYYANLDQKASLKKSRHVTPS